MSLTQRLIDQAIANRDTVKNCNGVEVPANYSHARAETMFGNLDCYLDFSHGNAASHGKHVSKRFKLAGKVMKRADIDVLFD